MKIWKYSGTLLLITGILHTITAFFIYWETYIDIVTDGIVNSIKEDITRNSAFWFLICGIFLIFTGQLLQHYIRKEQKPAPLFSGYFLLLFSVIGVVIMPLSGFWLFIPQAVIIILGNRSLEKIKRDK